MGSEGRTTAARSADSIRRGRTSPRRKGCPGPIPRWPDGSGCQIRTDSEISRSCTMPCQSQVGCRPDGRSFKISSASWPRSKAPAVPETLRRGTGQSLEESLITRRSWTRSRNLPPKRMQLLRGYFEPSEQEREEGRKLPTAAHRAIAQLIAKGYVQVVVTTNFDQLLEQALV